MAATKLFRVVALYHITNNHGSYRVTILILTD